MAACISCQKTKAPLECRDCAQSLCKGCAQFVDEGTFTLAGETYAGLIGTYCPTCYEAKAGPAVREYEDVVEKARNVDVFFKNQGKETRFLRRSEKPLEVRDSADRDETVLRLAYLAVQAGFNALIDVDLQSEKIRMGGWQSSKWHGRGIPVQVDPEQLKRKFISAPN
jgi:hypothetical protein